MKKKRLIDVVPEWQTKGVFTYLNEKEVPWDIPAANLDLAYFGNHSGEKIISPVVRKILVNDVLPDVALSNLATTIFYLYNSYWEKEWATLTAQYNPISNYDMTETETIERSGTESGTDGHTKTNTGTVIDAGTHSNTTTGSTDTTTSANNTSEDELSAFNSSDYVDDRKNTNAASATSDTDMSETRNGTTGNTRTDDLSEGFNGTHSGSHSDTEDRTLTRSGNIGVTTSQQMLESERELWLWNFFDDVVFPDIDKILTGAVY